MSRRASEDVLLDASSMGPPRSRKGEVMQAWWPDRVEHLVYNGHRWVHVAAECITPRDLDRGYLATPHWGSHR